MPALKTTIRWQRYEPDLPGNRANKPPFYFEIAADLTKEQFASVMKALNAVDDFPAPPKNETPEQAAARTKAQHGESVKRSAEALDPYVKFGVEPLSLDGEEIRTLEQYLSAVSRFQSLFFFQEPATMLGQFNSLGPRGFFSERLSGGIASTASRRNG